MTFRPIQSNSNLRPPGPVESPGVPWSPLPLDSEQPPSLWIPRTLSNLRPPGPLSNLRPPGPVEQPPSPWTVPLDRMPCLAHKKKGPKALLEFVSRNKKQNWQFFPGVGHVPIPALILVFFSYSIPNNPAVRIPDNLL